MKIHYLLSYLEDSEAVRALPLIFKTLTSLGHEVSLYILCPPPDYLPHELRDSLLEGLADIPCQHLFKTQKSVLSCCNMIAGLLRHNRPDFVITSQKKATIAGQIAGHFLDIPVVSWKHGFKDEKFFHARQRFSRLWIADSPTVRLYLNKEMGLPCENILTWPLYQPLRALLWSAEGHLYWRGEGKLRLGFLATDHSSASKACLAKALVKLKEKRPNLSKELSLLVGHDPASPKWRKRLSRPQLSKADSRRLSKLGDFQIEEVQASLKTFYLHTDLFLPPLTGTADSMHLYEAMSAGAPSIAPPFPDMVRAMDNGRNGIVLPKTSPALLAQAIDFYLTHPEILEKKGRNALAWIKKTYNKQNFLTTGKEIITQIEAVLAQDKKEKIAQEAAKRLAAPKKQAS